MYVLLACLHVLHVYTCCPGRLEEGTQLPGTGVRQMIVSYCVAPGVEYRSSWTAASALTAEPTLLP